VELAEMEVDSPCCADSVRFTTNGGQHGSIGVSTLAVFSAPPEEGLQRPGDCNQDGMVNILDALFASQGDVGLVSLNATQFSNCNVTGALEPNPGAVVNAVYRARENARSVKDAA
jgi:hypothetical protein